MQPAGDLYFHIEAAVFVGGAGPLHVSLEGETTQPFTPKPLPFITMKVGRLQSGSLPSAYPDAIHMEDQPQCLIRGECLICSWKCHMPSLSLLQLLQIDNFAFIISNIDGCVTRAFRSFLQRLKFSAAVVMSDPPVLEALEFHASVRSQMQLFPCLLSRHDAPLLPHC